MANFFWTILSFLLCLIPICQSGVKSNEWFILLNVIIAFMCCCALFSKKSEPFSLYKVFYIFMLFFFCIAPVVQFKSNVHILGTYFSDDLYVRTSAYTLLALVIFECVYHFTRKHKKIRLKPYPPYPYSYISDSKERVFIILSTIVLLLVLYMNNFSFSSLLFRGGNYADRKEIEQITGLIFSRFVQPIPLMLFLFACIFKVRHQIVLWILFMLLLLSNPPTGMARLAVAGVYIPVLLMIVPVLRKKNVFVLIMVLGLLIVFPFLNNFRNFTGEITTGLNFDQFSDINFDSYSMFMRAIDYTSGGGYSYGYQLLGVILFFVPRSIWTTKPSGSGNFIGNETYLETTNISMPPYGEGWLNFGFLGFVLFTIVLAYILAYYDKRYWNYIVKNKQDIRQVGYYIFIGMLTFIMRGDLMSGWAYTCGMLCSYWVMRKVLFK